MHYIVSPPEGHGHLALTSREVTNNWCQSVSEETSPTEQGESKGEGRPPTLLPLPDGDECMKGYSITATSKQIANSDRCCVPRYRTRGTQSYMHADRKTATVSNCDLSYINFFSSATFAS